MSKNYRIITETCYIDGKWIKVLSKDYRELFDPSNGEAYAKITLGGQKEAEEAVLAAKGAFEDFSRWQGLGYDGRKKILYRIADLMEENKEILARAESKNQGMPVSFARDDVSLIAQLFRYNADLACNLSGQNYGKRGEVLSATIRKPVGVCAVISPWNYPLFIGCGGISAALAAGNTVVFKPAEITPMSALILFNIFEEAGVPAGVVNLVIGSGSIIGNYLAESNLVDRITFVGSTATGRSIMKASASNFKSILLELGGKSPFVVFEDADLEKAADDCILAIFTNAGQTCTAGSRLIVQDSIYDHFMKMLVHRADCLKLGAGMDESTNMGPLVSMDHMESVLKFIQDAKNAGATLLCGGKRATLAEQSMLANGYFVEPTIFVDVTKDMDIWKKEIFGPVLCVMKFVTEEEALILANDSEYGLASGIYTKNLSRAHRFADAIEAGVVWINGYFNGINETPAGGWKNSGLGYEQGLIGLEGYTKIKQINITL